MSGNAAFFTQDFWKNSIAIGHPLVYHSQTSSKHETDNACASQWNVMDMSKGFITILYPIIC